MTDTPQTDVLGDPKASHKELVDGLDRVKPKPQTDSRYALDEKLLVALGQMWLRSGGETVNSGKILDTVMPVIKEHQQARELEIKKEAYNRGYNSGYVGAKKGRSNKKDASFKAYIEKLVDDRIEELESKKKST